MMLPSLTSLLMTPPEGEPLHSFQSSDDNSYNLKKQSSHQQEQISSTHLGKQMAIDTTRKDLTPAMKTTIAAGQQPSPPVSPEDHLAHRRDSSRTLPRSSLATVVVDPVLFPSQEAGSTAPSESQPLFPQPQDQIGQAIEQHMSNLSVHYMRGKSGDTRTLRYQMPSHSEYRLAVTFTSALKYGLNTLKRQRDEDQENYPNAKRLGVQRPSVVSGTPVKPKKAAPRTKRSQVVSEALQPAGPKASKQPVNESSPEQMSAKKAATPRKPIPRAAPSERGRGGQSASGHTRNREPKKPIDVNWRAIVDYSPSTDMLDQVNKPLKVDWEGSPQKMDGLVDLEHLHPAEVVLASTLRLDPARYLTCKRRIFEKRLECLKNNKDFKKTDAQQACQIDVNKASRIWAAYNEIGWFQVKHFKQYL